MTRDLRIARESKTEKPKAPNCPVCLDTGIVKADGSPRKLTGEYCTMRELLTDWEPCGICELGAIDKKTREQWL